MRTVEPEVFLVARPEVDYDGVAAYLREVGGERWLERLDRNQLEDDGVHPDAQNLAELAGRICYRSWEPGLNPNVTRVRTDQVSYLENVLRSGHGSVLEHVSFTFVLHNVSRVFTHEVVRHRPGTAISQESLRFVRLDEIPFWFPDWAREDPELMKRATALLAEMEAFQGWLAEHFKLDDAGVPFHEKKHKTSFMRRFAPDGVATGLVWTANIRALRHTIEMRTDPGAEEEIRLVFGKIGAIMRAEAPALFGDYQVTDEGAWVPGWRKVLPERPAMTDAADILLRRRVLVVDDALRRPDTAVGRAVRGLITELARRGVEVTESFSYEDGAAVVASDAGLCAVMVDWGLADSAQGDAGKQSEPGECASRLMGVIRSRNATLPVFLLARGDTGREITIEAMEHADELVWVLQDTAEFIVGRVLAAMDRYVDGLLPPFFRALLEYNREQEYTWAVPGHQGGVAYLKTPVGRMFRDFYGENLFRTDMGIERVSLGSLLDHTGPIGASEAYAARVFGAHRTYSGLVGTSGSNRAVMSGVLASGDLAIIDRNAHKSIMQGLQITGAVPVYLIPSRNRYGIIGPIRPAEMTAEAIAAKIESSPLVQAAGAGPAVGEGGKRAAASYAVITNSTYDGLCYDAAAAQRMLEPSADVIHFDEAWYGYARFHPLYEGRFAMRGDPAAHPPDGPTVFSTQSSHKLLAALSQASFIHVREGHRKVPHGAFNEAYMMHATTSPLYALIAANDVATSMMDGPGGRALIQETIDEAVAFRQTLARAHRQFSESGDWFFAPWNAPEVTDPVSGKRLAFADAPAWLLCSEPACWVLHPGERWHGFAGIEDGWCMLDPTKAGILAPGMGDDGDLGDWGVPATLLTAYLGRHGIVPSRTTDHIVLCLFSVGITRGKWGTLLNALLAFKRDWDANAQLAAVLPDVLAADRARYAGLGLRDLGMRMWAHMRANPPGPALQAAFATLPGARFTPREAYDRLVRRHVELVPFGEMAGRTLAVGLQPYPPGIPILLPGEDAGAADGPFLSYLSMLQAWDAAFPGFEHEIEGTERVSGGYAAYCVS